METTNALLANLVQTKSIERVLAPIAAQVSQLIILNEAYEKGDKGAFSHDTLPDAGSVQNATLGLVTTVQNMAAESPDEDFKTGVVPACDLLVIAGENLVAATKRVKVENFSFESRRHLVRMSKDVLEGTMKVLLVADDAEVRKIVHSGKIVTDRLALLSAVSSMKHLVAAFKGFTESVMLLCSLADRRQQQLTHPKQRERIISSMTQLRKSVPMLSSALQTYAKYNINAQAKASKEYMLAQTLAALTELVGAAENKPSVNDDESDMDEHEEAGHFISKIDKILDWLSGSSRLDTVDTASEFDLLMEALIRHSMAVAHISQESQRELIIRASQRVLKQRNIMNTSACNLIDNPDFKQLRADFDNHCEILMNEFQDLERHVNDAALQMFVEVFRETTEPLDRMVKIGLTQDSDGEDVDAYIEAFNSHSDLMCQVARFIAASSPDARRVRVIHGCICQLEKLDPEIVPAMMACCQSPHDKASLEHLRLLKREWTSEIAQLVAVLDDIMDPAMFIHVSELQARENLQEVKSSLYADNGAVVMETSRALCGRARRVVTIATRVVDNNEDPVFRNGLMVYVNKLSKVIPAVKSAASHMVENMGNIKSHEKLHKRACEVVDCLAKVHAGLIAANHPDLLSPDRYGVRSLSDERGFDFEDQDIQNIGQSYDKPEAVSRHFTIEEKPSSLDYKNFILGILDSQVSQLSKDLVTAAVGGNRKNVDLLSNDVLSRTNHITDVATAVAAHCTGETNISMLQQLCSHLTSVTPELLDCSVKVSECDVQQVEPLHEKAQDWAQSVSQLEYLVDGIIDKWKSVVNKVVDAAKVCDITLLKAETLLLEEHRRCVSQMVVMASASVNQSDVMAAGRIQMLYESQSDFENNHTMVCVVSDIVSKSDDSAEHVQLERAARDWATRVFCIISSIDKLAQQSLENIHMIGPSGSEGSKVEQFVQNTLTLKSLVNQMLTGRTDSEAEQVFTLLDDLDKLNAGMHDLVKVIPISAASYVCTEDIYAPHKLLLLQCQWATKAQQIRSRVDSMTVELCAPLDKMFNIAIATTQNSASPDDLHSVQEAFNRMVMSARSKALDTIQMSGDLEKKRIVRQQLEDLTKVTEEVKMATQAVADDCSEENRAAFQSCKRQWVGAVQGLLSTLDTMADVDTSAKTDFSKILKSPMKSVSFSSTMPDMSPHWSDVPSLSTHIVENTANHSTADITTTSQFAATENLRKGPAGGAQSSINTSMTQKAMQTPPPPLRPKPSVKTENVSGSVIKTTPYGVTFKSKVTGGQGQTHVAEKLGELKVEDLISPQTSERVLSATPSERYHIQNTTAPVGEMSHHSVSFTDTSRIQHRQPEKRTSTSPFRFSNTSRSIAVAALNLQQEAEKWEDDNNPIVRVAKEMSQQMYSMAEYTRGEGPIINKEDMIKTAKEVANKGKEIVKFATILSEYCIDKRFSKDLMFYANHIPTMSTQLNIIASVKAATPDDRTAEKVLVKNAENLMEAVIKTLKAAEATCVKGLKQPPSTAHDEAQAVVLAVQWKRKFLRHRWMEVKQADIDDLGLRRIEKLSTAPTLSQIVLRR